MTADANEKRTPRAIFLAVRQVVTPDEQSQLLKEMCAGQEELQRRVKEMLVAARSEQTNRLERLGAVLNAPQWKSDSLQLDIEKHPLIGPYKLHQRLGEGGMGEVFLAEQKKPLQRTVALKLIKRGLDSREVLGRFEAERQALSLMNHPYIARVLDAGESDDGRPYFVMELVRGISITDYCDQHKLTTRERLELFINVCQAVQHAHQKGVIHRDLKPSNIMVELHDVRHVPKVIDFGVAKATHQRLTEHSLLTRFSQMIGTPLYMSPEQAELSGLDVDTRSDVYSLGVLLYELLTGRTPFDSETLKQAGFDEMRRIIREEEPPKPSAKVSTLRAEALSTVSQQRGCDPRRLSNLLAGELDWIVMKALEKDRNRRYESASALAADVQRYLDGQAVEACPPSKFYRVRKFASRYRLALTTAIAIAVVLVAGVVGTTWQMLRAMSAERVAEIATKEVRLETNRARAEAERANEERRRAENEREWAIDNLKLARSIVDTLYLQVGTQWIAEETGPSGFQQGILSTAAKFYEELTEIQVTSPSDLSELSLVCSGYGRIGAIEHYLQNYEEAIEARRKAVDLVRRGLAVEPHNPAIRSALSENQYDLGQSLVELARYDEAIQAFDESSTTADQLVREAVDPVKHRYWMARVDLARATVLACIGSVTESIRLARNSKDDLNALSNQTDMKELYWGDLHNDRRRADYVLAKSLAYAGELAEATALCEQALASCRRQRSIQHDDARLRTLEIDFLELSAELAGIRGDLPAAAEQYRNALDTRLKGLRAGVAPSVFFTKAVFAGSIKLDGMIEPGPFCSYVETHLRLADVLRRVDRPYEAEAILGECRNVTVPVVAERTNALRYRIADVNSWVLAAELLAERRPADAETAFRRARQLWTNNIQQFPHAKLYVSGTYGHQPDWERFQGVGHLFMNVRASDSDDKEVNTQETVFHQHSWSGRSWARAGIWKKAIDCFNRSAELRVRISDDDRAYDWFQLAIAHAQLGEHDQAQTWLHNAEESIDHLSVTHDELIELRDEARAVVEKDGIKSK